MKLDKETLIKQKFWVSLCAIVPLLLIVWLVLVFGVSDTVGGEKKKYDDGHKKADGVLKNEQKNEKFVEKFDASRTVLTSQKDVVWKKAWGPQAQLMTWPQRLKQLSDDYYGDEIAEQVRRDFQRDLYWDQFLEFRDMIYPAEYENGWEGLLKYVGKGKKAGEWEIVPTTEECWLAQEDLWVQRELLRVVRDTIDSLAMLTADPEPKDVKAPAGTIKTLRFHNTNWEIDLFLKYNNDKQLLISEESTIKNINPSKRTLLLGRGKQRGLMLRLKQGQVEVLIPEVQGEPVVWNQSSKFKNASRIDNFNPDLKDPAFQLYQVFDWYTSPVKRVDNVALGKHGHRFSNYPLIARSIGPKEEEKKADDTSGQQPGGAFGNPGVPGSPMSGASGMGMAGVGGSGFGGGANAAVDVTPNGLDRKRYIQVEEQVRRMPVGLVVVADQAYVADLLVAFANSKLRVQTTQFHWHHVQGIRSKAEEAAAAPTGGGLSDSGSPRPGSGFGTPGGGKAPPGMGAPGKSGGPGSGFGSSSGPPKSGSSLGGPPGGVGGGKGVPGPPTGGGAGAYGPMSGGAGGGGNMRTGDSSSSDASAIEEDVPNLVEVSIYGVASLYERFPAKPKPGAPGTTPTGGAPK